MLQNNKDSGIKSHRYWNKDLNEVIDNKSENNRQERDNFVNRSRRTSLVSMGEMALTDDIAILQPAGRTERREKLF